MNTHWPTAAARAAGKDSTAPVGTLFDMETVRMDSPRLVALREHDVQTHFSADSDPQWMAIPMNAARRYLFQGTMTDEDKAESVDIPTITMNYCRLLDEAGLICVATTEREAQDLALAAVRVAKPAAKGKRAFHPPLSGPPLPPR